MLKTAREFLQEELYYYLGSKGLLNEVPYSKQRKLCEAVTNLLDMLEMGGYLQVVKKKGKNFKRGGRVWEYVEPGFLYKQRTDLEVIRVAAEEREKRRKALIEKRKAQAEECRLLNSNIDNW